MFDQLVSEKTARKRFAVVLSLSGEIGLLGLTILFPLMRTAAVTPGRLTQSIPVLRPWGPSISEHHTQSSNHERVAPALRVFTDHTFRQPASIPAGITSLDDAPSIGPLTTGPAGGGVPDGVFGGVSEDVIPAPKPAPPAAPRATVTAPPRLKVGGVVQSAKLLRQPAPVYPPLAKSARISGVVRLEAVIGRTGTIESLRVMSGHPLLVDAALAAVRQWVYQPTLLNGDPVEVLTQIEVHFKLGE